MQRRARGSASARNRARILGNLRFYKYNLHNPQALYCAGSLIYALRMLNATVHRRIELTKELVIFQIRPDAGVPDFKPGQYVALGLLGSAARDPSFPAEIHPPPAPDKLIKRAYSIGSSPDVREYVEFYIAIAEQGALTARLALVQEGDRIYMAPKITGTFTTCDVAGDHNLILVSTGTGIAPYMSMLRHPAVWTPGRHITLLHGVRHASDLAYRDELLALAQSRPADFTYKATISRNDPSWQGERGYVQKFFEPGQIALNPELDHVFICGNPAMIDELQTMLEKKDFRLHTKRNPGNLHLEKYW